MKKPDRVRLAVFSSLVRMEEENRFANLELGATLRRESFENSEKAFYTRLFYGVIERKIALDTLISTYARVKKRIEPKVKILLQMGIYQILYMDSVPDHAAAFETVEMTKLLTHEGASGFVNGILRAIIRDKNALPLPPEGTIERLSFESGISPEILSLWHEQYGQTADEIALALSRTPPLTLRVNTLKTSAEQLLSALSALGIEAEKASTEGSVRLLSSCPIDRIEPLTQGLCFVQDEASSRAAMLLGAMPGERVLDACACPGGKSFAIALMMENTGQIESRDVHESKLSLIENTAKRMGISIISTHQQDAREALQSDFEAFDRVLCDVPCSGLGVIAKKPDLRHKTLADIERLPAIQISILKASADAVKVGGVLVYSTCTLNKRENEDVVSAFLLQDNRFSLADEGMKVLFPMDGTDGFFMAKLVKNRS